VTASEAYARAETCARLAKYQSDPLKRTSLEKLRLLWLTLARRAHDPAADVSIEFDRLLEVHTGLCQRLGLGRIQ
jgi:hypothetical protein